MRRIVLLLAVVAACGDSSPPEVAPEITSFTIEPSTIPPGVAAMVTWSWTYADNPSPPAHCTIAGIGDVTNGETSSVTVGADTSFELTCTNGHGSDTATTAVRVANGPGAPLITSFTVSPNIALIGDLTQLTFTWTLADTTMPDPSCTIDQGVGAVSGGTAIRVMPLSSATVFTLTCTSSSGLGTAQAPVAVRLTPVAPQLATFSATPGAVVGGTATNVTFDWTYANVPVPLPSCTIDHGIGTIVSGNTKSITLAADTLYTLTCSNAAGTTSRQLTVPVLHPPSIASFSATPTTLTAGVATSVTWNWTFSPAPVPPAMCMIDHGVGAVTPGAVSSVTIAGDTVYTLTCTNLVGTSTQPLTLTATPPVAPTIAAFAIAPSSVYAGDPSSLRFTWSYANTPAPAPACSVDQGIGAVGSGDAHVVMLSVDTTYTLTCTNSGGTATSQQTVTVLPPVAPQLASFTATPGVVLANTTTAITWSWSYANAPVPAPKCSLDQGFGDITPGGATNINLAADRTYTLTCANAGGTASASTTIRIGVAPVLASFTVTPSQPPNPQTPVTWNWTYANTPVPAPSCSIEHGIGAVTQGATSYPGYRTRTYQLMCSNLAGFDTAEVTLTIDECAAGLGRCDANAHCVDTLAGYDCECNAGFAGDGATCGAIAACDSNPAACDPKASCEPAGAAFACQCPAGYVGDGLSCQRLPIAFVTSVAGSGNLSTWPDAGGQAGLAAGDAICQARATAAGLPGTYVAALSDNTSSLQCRVHGLSGTFANGCGLSPQPAPTWAGPWVRPDGLPFLGKVGDASLLRTYYADGLNELGQRSPAALVWSGGGSNTNCSGWTATNGYDSGVVGAVFGGARTWMESLEYYTKCYNPLPLRCVEVADGPPLPPLRSSAKKVFLSTLLLPATMRDPLARIPYLGIQAADAICQRDARSGGLPNADRFKAWLSTSTQSAAARFSSGGPWARTDGVVVARTRQDLITGTLLAPIDVDATGEEALGGRSYVWTGFQGNGSTGATCMDWTSTAQTQTGVMGFASRADRQWTQGVALDSGFENCSYIAQLYCFED